MKAKGKENSYFSFFFYSSPVKGQFFKDSKRLPVLYEPSGFRVLVLPLFLGSHQYPLAVILLPPPPIRTLATIQCRNRQDSLPPKDRFLLWTEMIATFKKEKASWRALIHPSLSDNHHVGSSTGNSRLHSMICSDGVILCKKFLHLILLSSYDFVKRLELMCQLLGDSLLATVVNNINGHNFIHWQY